MQSVDPKSPIGGSAYVFLRFRDCPQWRVVFSGVTQTGTINISLTGWSTCFDNAVAIEVLGTRGSRGSLPYA